MATPVQARTPVWQAFVVGGVASCVATTIIMPFDVLKTRIQLQGAGTRARSPSLLAAGRVLVAAEGVRGLYAGLSAAYARQIVYGSARLGLFRVFSDALVARRAGPPEPLPLWQKAIAGLCAGGLGSLIGNPIEVALVRLQADGALPSDARRGYSGLFNALRRIVREEGPAALYSGAAPTVARAIALNTAMLATADELRERLTPALGSTAAMGAASLASGCAAAAASLPFDLAKSRLQSQRVDAASGRAQYSGLFDCLSQTVRTEGVTALWKGLTTYTIRIAPHAVITLSLMNALTRALAQVRAF